MNYYVFFWCLVVCAVRGAGFIHSLLLDYPGRVSKDHIHVTDWLPTILSLAGVKIPENKSNGYNQEDTSQNEEASPREEILVNIDEKASQSNSGLIKNERMAGKFSVKVISLSFLWIFTSSFKC